MKPLGVFESIDGRAPGGGPAGNRTPLRSRAAWSLAATFSLLALLVHAAPVHAQTTVYYEQNANGQAESVVISSSTLNYNYPDDNDWSQSYTTGSFNGGSYESAPSNWSTPDYPNGTNTNIVINADPVQLDVSVAIDSLTLSNGATLTTDANTTLGINGNLIDNGELIVGPTTVTFANAIISGSGAIDLTGGVGGDGFTPALLTGTYTQQAGHTIEGTGILGGAFINNSTVISNNSNPNVNNVMALQTSSLTNNGVLESGSYSELDFDGITVTQGTGGQILSTGSASYYEGYGGTDFRGVSQVNGGTLNTSGYGLIEVLDSSNTTFNSVTNQGTVGVLDNGTLNITGTLVDNGKIVINYFISEGTSDLNFENSVLTGTGDSILNAGLPGGGNPIAAILSGTLTQMAGHTISGIGDVEAALTNYGVVDATFSTQRGPILRLAINNMTNYNVMEATGSPLEITGITVTQGTGGQIFADGNTVTLDTNATVSGGTLNAASGGYFVIGESAATLNNVTNNAPVNITDGYTLNITGSLNNNGSINVGTPGTGAYVNFTGGTVSGSGSISLQSQGFEDDAEITGTLTQAAGHSIAGVGEITAALTNYGVVNATGASLILTTSSMTNYNVMEASGTGAVLDISGNTITQGAGGQLLAKGGIVQLDSGATIIGGALNASSGGTFVDDGNNLNYPVTLNNVTNNATVDLLDNNCGLTITGNLIDNGEIVVNTLQGGGVAIVDFNGGMVSGSGSIILNDGGSGAQLSGTLTQTAGHTVSGYGQINANITNYGVVNANVNGEALTLTGSTTNGGTMEATNGGTLGFNGGAAVNNDIIKSGSGSFLTFNSVTLSQGTGGQLMVNAGGTAELSGGAVVAGGTIVVSSSSAQLIGSGQISSSLTNYGVLNADINGQTLELTGSNVTNYGTLEGSAGGTLDINGITVTQGTGGQLYANNGAVQFDGADIIKGGALTSANGGVFLLNSGTTTFNTLTNNSTVDTAAGTTLNVTGALIDNGAIIVYSRGSGSPAFINFAGGIVSGTGDIDLNAGGAQADLSGTLTQLAGHTIYGEGEITAALTNYGLVNSNYNNQVLSLAGSNMVNNGVMEASASAILDIDGITVTQGTGGQLYANNGTVQFDGADTVKGGALTSANGGVFLLNSGTTAFNNLTNNSAVDTVAGTTLNVTGTLTDNGTIIVYSRGSGSPAFINIAGGIVSGTGDIDLNAGGAQADLSGTLTQLAGHTIYGEGEITAALTNYGLVNANYNNQVLSLAGSNMVNNGVMEASASAILDIDGITVTQGTGGQLYANNGTVQFDGADTVKGGALTSANGGVFLLNSGTTTFNNLTNNSTVDTVAGTTLNVTGTLTDNSAIVVHSRGSGSPAFINFAGGIVTGTGDIDLNAGGAQADLSGTLTQLAGHTIYGEGEITAAMKNYGLVNANYNNQILTLTGTTTNYGKMQASGGILSFNAGVLTNLSGATLTGGTYEVDAGSTINLPGSVDTNAATVILNGAGSTFGAINGIGVNKGEFEVLDGETFDTAGALVNSGAVVTSTAGALAVNGALTEDGSGTLAIAGGGAFSDTSGYIGSGGAGTASVTVSGSGSSWTNTGNVAVGYSGTGRLVVTTGGAVSDGSGFIGYAAGSSGGVTVSGSGAKWTTAAGLNVGDLGTGALTITGGGAVSVTGATTIGSLGVLQFDGGSTFSTGSLAVNGGKLVTLGAATFSPSATLGAGGMIVNSEGFNSTFTGNFSGAGGITKSGSGTITLTGAGTYTGATSVDAGTLALTTGTGHTASLGNTAITVASGATFDASAGAAPFNRIVSAGTTASGTAGATLKLNPGSSFSMAGASLATFDLQQESAFSGPAFTIGGASGIAPSLIFDIGNAATGPDLLRVTKTVSVLATGGDITIDPLTGDSSLTAGSYYLIISAGGFSGTGGNGLALSGTTLAVDGTTYDLSLAHSTADDEILTVTDAPATPSALTDEPREEALGGTSAVPAGKESAPLAGTTAVPEPGTTMSLLSAFGMAGAWMLRRRRG